MARIVGYEGLLAEHASFNSALTPDAIGKVFKVSANRTVALCAAEDKISGKAEQVEGDGVVTGQIKGFVEIPYTGAAPTVGEDQELVADGAGGVKKPAAAGTGKQYTILYVDAARSVVGFLM